MYILTNASIHSNPIKKTAGKFRRSFLELILVFVCIFTKTFVRITARNYALADEIAAFMQTCGANLWRFGANVPVAAVCATPHNNFI